MSTHRLVPVPELVASGYLLDLNRRWAHPLGLEALVTVEGGTPRLLGFADARHLPGGPFFADRMPADAAAKAARMHAERDRRASWRREHLGAAVEPVEGDAHVQPVAGLADGARDWERIVEACASLGADLAAEMPGMDAQRAYTAERAADLALHRLLVPLIQRASIDGVGRIAFADQAPADTTDGTFHPARLRALIARIPELQEDHGQLYPEQVARLTGLAQEADAALDAGDAAAIARLLDEAEALFGLAQPGMRWWLGDKEAWRRFEEVRPALKSRVAEVMGRRGEAERLLSGDLAAEDVQDVAGVVAEVERQLAPLVEQLADLDEALKATVADREAVARKVAKMEAALLRLQHPVHTITAPTPANADAVAVFINSARNDPAFDARAAAAFAEVEAKAASARGACQSCEVLRGRVRFLENLIEAAAESLEEAEDTDIILSLSRELRASLRILAEEEAARG